MADKILVLGRSGTGKTFSLRNIDPKTSFYINVDRKSMPFKGWRKKFHIVKNEAGEPDFMQSNYTMTSDPNTIWKLIKAISSKRPEIKFIIVDTLTLMMTDMFMSQISIKGYDKYSNQANTTYQIVKMIDGLREDLTVVFMAHIETENYETSFFVPGGKLLKEKIKMESNFTTVIQTYVEYSENGSNKYYFLTENSGDNTVKSPKDMFPGKIVENDLAKVIEHVKAFEEDREIDPKLNFTDVQGGTKQETETIAKSNEESDENLFI